MRSQASRGWQSKCASEGIPEVRGYGVMSAYRGEPAQTAQAIDTDGFLRTMGRYKHMLQVGGENADPTEVEAFLEGHRTSPRSSW